MRFDVRESWFLTGRGPWVAGDLASGELAAGDEVAVAHTGATVRIREVRPHEGGFAVRLDRADAAGVPPGSVLVEPGAQVARVAPPQVPAPGPVHYEVLDTFSVTGRGPVVAGLLRRGDIRGGDVLAVAGSGATVRITTVELHRRETVDGVVLGIGLHPDDAARVQAGSTLVSREGHDR